MKNRALILLYVLVSVIIIGIVLLHVCFSRSYIYVSGSCFSTCGNVSMLLGLINAGSISYLGNDDGYSILFNIRFRSIINYISNLPNFTIEIPYAYAVNQVCYLGFCVTLSRIFVKNFTASVSYPLKMAIVHASEIGQVSLLRKRSYTQINFTICTESINHTLCSCSSYVLVNISGRFHISNCLPSKFINTTFRNSIEGSYSMFVFVLKFFGYGPLRRGRFYLVEIENECFLCRGLVYRLPVPQTFLMFMRVPRERMILTTLVCIPCMHYFPILIVASDCMDDICILGKAEIIVKPSFKFDNECLKVLERCIVR